MASKPKKLALLGPPGTFSSIAADAIKKAYKRKYVFSFKSLFHQIQKGIHGLLPYRNKVAGKIMQTEKFLKKFPTLILHRIRIPVKLVMAGHPKAKLRDIRKIFVMPVVKVQCKKFLKKYFPKASFVQNFDSSGYAFKKIVQLKGIMLKTSAAIGSEKSAKLHGLKIMARNIQDKAKSWTEFILVEKKDTPKRKSRRKK